MKLRDYYLSNPFALLLMSSVRPPGTSLSLEQVLETLTAIAHQIHQASNLVDILSGAVRDVRALIQSDRVLIYQFLPDGDGLVVAESVGSEWKPILGHLIYDSCFQSHWAKHYQQGHVRIIDDIQTSGLAPCHLKLLSQCQVRANLVVPILNAQQAWGLLIGQQCRDTRQWQPIEVQIFQQVAAQLGTAVQRCDLSQQVHQLNQALAVEEQCHPPHRQQVEEALLQSYQQLASHSDTLFRGVFEQAIVGIGLMNQAGQFLRANQRLSQLLGYTEDELQHTTLFDLLPPDDCLLSAHDDIKIATGEIPAYSLDIQYRRKDGQVQWTNLTTSPIYTSHGDLQCVLAVFIDITERKQAETLLRLQSAALTACADVIMITDSRGRIEWVNPAFTTLTGYKPKEALGRNPRELVKSGHHDPAFYRHLWKTILSGQVWRGELVNRRKDGTLYIEETTITPVNNSQGAIDHFVAIKQDISHRKQLEMSLQQQREREHLLAQIAQNIRRSLDLDQILTTVVAEVRQFLQTDRVLIYRLHSDGSGWVMTESVAAGCRAIVGTEMTDSCFVGPQGRSLDSGQIYQLPDIYSADLSQEQLDRFEQFQIRAKLVVPIWQTETPWGFLIAHQCHESRNWQPFEAELLAQLATQLAIAIQQSELYGQVQHLNQDLQLQVQERTAQLQQSLIFEAMLKRITDNVRDSLDEQQILQTVVVELAQVLHIQACDTGIYNADHSTSTIVHEFVTTLPPAQGMTFSIADSPHPDIYPLLFQGQSCQFCNIAPNPIRSEQQFLTTLACPILDDQGILGDLWLFKLPHQVFNDLEVRLVQQIANQCAIALRQSRLYQAAQAQVKELERLNYLKDDFLSTVSHELRTPITNIKLATDVLEVVLEPLGLLTDPSNTIYRYFQILKQQCQREIQLVNDLLQLTHLDAGTDPLNLTLLDLRVIIPHIAEPFTDCMQQQQQHLRIHMPDACLPLLTDLSYLDRIITELLQNACKYTPADETIEVSVQLYPHGVEIQVSNSGVEITPQECDRIFDKFYRIPHPDRWRHSGTGLGLALVKRMVESLQGAIAVQSQSGRVTFTIHLPHLSEDKT